MTIRSIIRRALGHQSVVDRINAYTMRDPEPRPTIRERLGALLATFRVQSAVDRVNAYSMRENGWPAIERRKVERRARDRRVSERRRMVAA